jgi:hypothetical protein
MTANGKIFAPAQALLIGVTEDYAALQNWNSQLVLEKGELEKELRL